MRRRSYGLPERKPREARQRRALGSTEFLDGGQTGVCGTWRGAGAQGVPRPCSGAHHGGVGASRRAVVVLSETGVPPSRHPRASSLRALPRDQFGPAGVDAPPIRLPDSRRFSSSCRRVVARRGCRSGIPYGTVNLKRGVPKGETTESSVAGAGSLALEFSVLSALTNDGRFAEVSRGAGTSGGCPPLRMGGEGAGGGFSNVRERQSPHGEDLPVFRGCYPYRFEGVEKEVGRRGGGGGSPVSF